MRRVLVVVAVAVGVQLVFGTAWAEDLGDYFDRATISEFSGRQVVVTWTGSGWAAGAYDVSQAGGTLVIRDDDEMVMVAPSGLIGSSAQGLQLTRMTSYAPWRLSSRYHMSEPQLTQYLGRPTRMVEVSENSGIRARFFFDQETHVPLKAEAFGANGSQYRMSAYVDFRPGAASMPAVPQANPKMVVLALAETLPRSAGGYWLANSYEAPVADGSQAYYTDGLFAFSVFEIRGSLDRQSLPEAEALVIDGRRYERWYTPGEVWVTWSLAPYSYVLVGDLPPDHLHLVLSDLPEPDNPGFFVRLWRALFG